MTYENVDGGLVPIKAWTRGVPFEPQARAQVQQMAQLPIVGPHIAIMPDVHLGYGSTVGSVAPTRKAIVPAMVGVDIGCGMCAVRTSLTSHDVSDNAQDLFEAIARSVPHGGAPKNPAVGAWADPPVHSVDAYRLLHSGLERILEKHPGVAHKNASAALSQLGTLGGGNHFVEICLDESDRVWVMLHSGSRGIGNRIGTYFTELAKREMDRLDRRLPNRDMAYLEEGTSHFDDYVEAVSWAQTYAARNRRIMLQASLAAVSSKMKNPFFVDAEAINCHHNYVQQEEHFGERVWLTRKGAVSARAGELGIIPGSMGTKSFIVRGKGNADSFHSCSHGAGRVMARGEAKRTITVADHIAATEGIACRKDEGVIDESPRAYKRVEDVMAAQEDLVEIVHTLKQIVCVKG